MLQVADLHAYYGKSHILQGVSFHVGEGEIVSLLGRNGVGRSTTLKAVMGEVAPVGSIRFRDREIAGQKAHRIARLGIGYVPENRDIFPTLTVRQNLILGMKSARAEGRWRMEDLFSLFPQLEARADVPGGALSGGEQQMLTMGRALMGDPDLIMVDEPTEGLAPQMVERVASLLAEIAERGVAILLVEQKLTIALTLADRLYVMGHGRMVFEGTPDALESNPEIRREWLEV
ncbi:MAG: ABC transporter ATP-binding protein [Alphaproteobacteria bacterium]|nr:ABC transporter ATP-binding protein [Alphaproteobacteria bacterium]